VTDATANVTLTRSYAPYGDTLTSIGAGATAWQFAGEQRDASGLTFLRARYLSTTTGRFITQDEWPGEAQRPGTLHPYLYGLNNPIRYTDPSGLCVSGAVVDTILCAALIGGTIGAVAGGVGYWATHRDGSDGNWNQRDFANSIVVGGVSGIVGGAVGGGVGALFGTATLGQAIVGGAVGGAFSGGATQITSNLWRRYAEQELCVNWYDNVLEATVSGAAIGAVTGGVGYGIARGISYYRSGAPARINGFTPEEAAILGPEAGGGGEGGRSTILELGSGTGQNLINIRTARPNVHVMGIDTQYESALDLAQLRVRYSGSENISLVRGNYLNPPYSPGIADEVIAVAPGGQYGDVYNAVRGVAYAVSPGGRIYIQTDLDVFALGNPRLEGALSLLDDALNARGLSVASIGYGGASGSNPLGIPLETIHNPRTYLYVTVSH